MQCVWVMVLLLPAALSEKFKVVVPDAPVVGVSGSVVVLPCSVRGLDGQTSMNAEDMNITWSRSDLTDSVVHQYVNHNDLNTDQIPQYRGRTSVFKEELQRGNTSLSLSNIRLTDEGQYSCTVESRYWNDKLSVNLRVEVIGSQPVITVDSYDSETVSLLCKSEGWYPEPALQWMNSRRVNLTAEETETQRVADLYSVKRRVTVKRSDIDTFFCIVTQRDHKKEGHITAAAIYDHLPNPGRTAGIVVGVILLLVLLTVGAVYLYKERRKREEEIRKVRSYLISDGDGRLLHHNLSPRQWDYVEFTLLNSEQELKEFRLKRYVPSDRGVQKLQKVIASSTKALLNDCALTEESCSVLASVLRSVNSLKDLNLNKNKLQDSGVKKLSEGLKSEHCKLETLRLERCSLTEESCSVLASVLRSVNSLKDLNLSKNNLQDSGVKKISEGLKSKHCRLETLSLERCSLTEESCSVLASVLRSVNSLKDLNLSENELQDSGVKELSEGLKSEHCKLEILRLESCSLTEESCSVLVSVLRSVKSLKDLNLTENNLQDSGVKELSEGLKSEHCKLETLSLESCSLTEESCSDLVSVLRSVNSLKDLNLSKNNLLDSGVKKISEGLKSEHCKLETLSLKGCNLTEESCSVLVSVLRSVNSLKDLNLSKNNLLNSGVKKLSEGLKSEHCKLETLRLSNCRITYTGCAALTSALTENPSSALTQLDLNHNQITESGRENISQLKQKFPYLTVNSDLQF